MPDLTVAVQRALQRDHTRCQTHQSHSMQRHCAVEQEIVQSRNYRSEAARGQERCDFWRPGRTAV